MLRRNCSIEDIKKASLAELDEAFRREANQYSEKVLNEIIHEYNTRSRSKTKEELLNEKAGFDKFAQN